MFLKFTVNLPYMKSRRCFGYFVKVQNHLNSMKCPKIDQIILTVKRPSALRSIWLEGQSGIDWFYCMTSHLNNQIIFNTNITTNSLNSYAVNYRNSSSNGLMPSCNPKPRRCSCVVPANAGFSIGVVASSLEVVRETIKSCLMWVTPCLTPVINNIKPFASKWLLCIKCLFII